jgi:hypothetical protein
MDGESHADDGAPFEEALQQRRPAKIAQRFLSGELGVELETYEADQERECLRDQELAR